MEAKLEEMEKQQTAQAVESDRKDKLIEDLQKQLKQAQSDIKETNDRLSSSIDSKKSSKRIKRLIRDYYCDTHESPLSREDVATWELAYQLAMEDMSNFNGSDDNIQSYINKAMVKLKFNPNLIDEIYDKGKVEAEETYLESEFLFKTYRRIITYLDKMGVWDMVKDNEKDFRQAVADYLLLN